MGVPKRKYERVDSKDKPESSTLTGFFHNNDKKMLVGAACVFFLSCYVFVSSGEVGQERKQSIQIALNRYQERIYRKKEQVFRDQISIKDFEIEEGRVQIQRLENELTDLFDEIGDTRMQLETANATADDQEILLEEKFLVNAGQRKSLLSYEKKIKEFQHVQRGRTEEKLAKVTKMEKTIANQLRGLEQKTKTCMSEEKMKHNDKIKEKRLKGEAARIRDKKKKAG